MSWNNFISISSFFDILSINLILIKPLINLKTVFWIKFRFYCKNVIRNVIITMTNEALMVTHSEVKISTLKSIAWPGMGVEKTRLTCVKPTPPSRNSAVAADIAFMMSIALIAVMTPTVVKFPTYVSGTFWGAGWVMRRLLKINQIHFKIQIFKFSYSISSLDPTSIVPKVNSRLNCEFTSKKTLNVTKTTNKTFILVSYDVIACFKWNSVPN